MTLKCPICYGTGQIEAMPTFYRQRFRRIYMAVLQSANVGISHVDLAAHMYGPEEEATRGVFTVLRVHICDMNKTLLAINQRIISRDNHYYLDSRENANAQWESNKTWKTAEGVAKKETKKEGHGNGRSASQGK